MQQSQKGFPLWDWITNCRLCSHFVERAEFVGSQTYRKSLPSSFSMWLILWHFQQFRPRNPPPSELGHSRLRACIEQDLIIAHTCNDSSAIKCGKYRTKCEIIIMVLVNIESCSIYWLNRLMLIMNKSNNGFGLNTYICCGGMQASGKRRNSVFTNLDKRSDRLWLC